MSRVHFIAGDIHGHFNEWMEALRDLGYDQDNPDHWIVVLGDLLDRGSQNYECLKFVNSLTRKVLVRGNHEELMMDLLSRGYACSHDISNGTTRTLIECYQKKNGSTDIPEEAYPVIADFKEWEEWKTYYDSLVDYFEYEEFIFVHGWLPRTEDAVGNLIVHENWRDGDWAHAVWLNGMQEWASGRRLEGHTVFCGHFHTSWGHAHIDSSCSEWGPDAIFDPFVKKGIVAMDGCVAYTGVVNVARLKGKELTFASWEGADAAV